MDFLNTPTHSDDETAAAIANIPNEPVPVPVPVAGWVETVAVAETVAEEQYDQLLVDNQVVGVLDQKGNLYLTDVGESYEQVHMLLVAYLSVYVTHFWKGCHLCSNDNWVSYMPVLDVIDDKVMY